MNATFQATDTNQDGLLDKTEFSDCNGKINENASTCGISHMNEADVDEDEDINEDIDVEEDEIENSIASESMEKKF